MEPKKNIEAFYTDLQNQFPEIGCLPLWNDYDWSEAGNDNSLIMSAIADHIIGWERDDLERLFGFIETGFIAYDIRTTSFLYTDFLVTITEIKDKPLRESIKQMMKPLTWEHYQRLLDFYWEAGEAH